MRSKTLLTLAAALAVTVSAGACASRRAVDLADPDAAPAAGPVAPGDPSGAAPSAGAAGQTGAGALGSVGAVPGAPAPGSQEELVIAAGERVYFDTDSYSLREDALPVLAAQAQWLQRNPTVRVLIEGNADERGTREYNLGLGARRAAAVRQHLIERGIAPERIESVSYGKERPIDPGSDEAAWQRNRNARTAVQGG